MDGRYVALFLAIAVVSVGPVIYVASRRAQWALHALDGFVLLAVGSLVVLHIAPRALATGGVLAIAALAGGVALPAVLDPAHAIASAKRWALVIGLVGLAIHTAIDGAAIAQDPSASALSWAIVLHRLPAGILVWWLVRPTYGPRVSTIILVFVAICTAIGFGVGLYVDVLEQRPLAIFEAFVAGALLHVLIGHGPELHGHESGHGHSRSAEMIGAMLGISAIALVPEASGHEVEVHGLPVDASRLAALGFEIAPASILGFAIVGIAGALRPSFLSFGPGGAARAFEQGRAGYFSLAAAPLLGLEMLPLSLVLLGLKVTALRVAVSLGVAGIASLVQPKVLVEPHHGREGRLERVLRGGFVERFDDSAAWILLGLISAAILHGTGVAHEVARLPSWLTIAAATVVALPLFVSSGGATPIAWVLIASSTSVGAVLAFLVAGAGAHLDAISAVAKRFGRRAAAKHAVAIGGSTLVLCVLVDRFAGPIAAPADLAPLFDYGPIHRSAAALLLVLVAASLVRCGPRQFVRSVFRPAGDH